MDVIIINCMYNVIVFNLQRRFQETGDKVMTFGQLWRACSLAGPLLPEPVNADKDRKEFSKRVFDALEVGKNAGVLWVNRSGPQGREMVNSIGLTGAGVMHVKSRIFGHQDRAPRIDAEASRKFKRDDEEEAG